MQSRPSDRARRGCSPPHAAAAATARRAPSRLPLLLGACVSLGCCPRAGLAVTVVAEHGAALDVAAAASPSEPAAAAANWVPGAQAVTVTAEEVAGKATCSFKMENGAPASCSIEEPDHDLVKTWIVPSMTVLELGARYGTTTCAIASMQANSGRLVAVEPDSAVWSTLEANLKAHHCKASIHRGVVGTQPRTVVSSVYSTRASALLMRREAGGASGREGGLGASGQAATSDGLAAAAASAPATTAVPTQVPPLAAVAAPPAAEASTAAPPVVAAAVASSTQAPAQADPPAAAVALPTTPAPPHAPVALAMSLAALEAKTGLRFDTLMVDCEGCFAHFLDENQGSLDHITTILIEADMGFYGKERAPDCGHNCIDYNQMMRNLEGKGFRILQTFKEGPGSCCPWIHHFVLKRLTP